LFPRTEVHHLDPITVLRDAFTSRSCNAPQLLHTHDLTINPLTPRGPRFWSAITAIAVVQTEFRATQTTARDQFIGAAIGGITASCAFLAFGPHQFVYAAAVAGAMLTCWALNVASASRLAGTTATIILLVPHAGSPWGMFGSRLAEVGWGVSVAVATIWLAARLPARYWS
jgi:uncharacterized membrane protein YgaE (UPF0421/DUF939 family)